MEICRPFCADAGDRLRYKGPIQATHVFLDLQPSVKKARVRESSRKDSKPIRTLEQQVWFLRLAALCTLGEPTVCVKTGFGSPFWVMRLAQRRPSPGRFADLNHVLVRSLIHRPVAQVAGGSFLRVLFWMGLMGSPKDIYHFWVFPCFERMCNHEP